MCLSDRVRKWTSVGIINAKHSLGYSMCLLKLRAGRPTSYRDHKATINKQCIINRLATCCELGLSDKWWLYTAMRSFKRGNDIQRLHNVRQRLHKVKQGLHKVTQRLHNVRQHPHKVEQGSTHNVRQHPHKVSQCLHNVRQLPHNDRRRLHKGRVKFVKSK